MWVYIQAIIVSIILILIIHYLFYYIRDIFTTKKTKDLVEIQTKKYKSIVEELIDVKKQANQPFVKSVTPDTTQGYLNQLLDIDETLDSESYLFICPEVSDLPTSSMVCPG